MIRYKIYQNQQKKGLNAGKWFARAVSDETVSYTHLDVYKRQSPRISAICAMTGCPPTGQNLPSSEPALTQASANPLQPG